MTRGARRLHSEHWPVNQPFTAEKHPPKQCTYIESRDF